MAEVTELTGVSPATMNVPALADLSSFPPPTPPGVPIPYPNINAHFEITPSIPVIDALFHQSSIVTGDAPTAHADCLLLV